MEWKQLVHIRCQDYRILWQYGTYYNSPWLLIEITIYFQIEFMKITFHLDDTSFIFVATYQHGEHVQ